MRWLRAANAAVVLCFALGLQSAGAPAIAGQTVVSSSTEALQADSPRELPNGARFVAPRGWSIRAERNAFILGAPEGDSHVAIVDGGAGDANAAVAAAWAVYRPGFSATPRGPQERAREGWDQALSYRYPSSAGAPRSLSALALRKGDSWTVVIRDITESVEERRDAQLEVIFNSLLPRGYERETFAGRTAHRLDETRIAQLTELVETARRELDIPGVALGLIENGEVVFAGGFGVRELGRPETVNADTLFNIASNGKPWTTLMLAKLVEDGRFNWDTPVVSIWPEFRLGDAETTRKVRVSQLICACTGMPRQDFEWLFEGDTSTAASMMQMLFATQPTSAFGDTYQYSNLMAAAGGYLGARVLYPRRELGAGYDAAMQRLVFTPLGMTSTTPDFRRALARNHAAGHAIDADGVTRIASQGHNLAAISTRPSGNHWSNVHDMLRYVRMELAGGLLPNGRRYIDQDVLFARRVPQVTTGLNEAYGMGLKIDRQWGVEVIHHGGSASGYRSDMIWLPQHGVGAVILTNSDSGSSLRSAFRRRLLEVLFDGEPTATNDLVEFAQRARAANAGRRAELGAPLDADMLAQLASRYRSAELGALEVRQQQGATWFDFGGWSSEMLARRDEAGAVTLTTITPGVEGYELTIANAGAERRLITSDAQHEYVFVAESQ